MLSLTQLPWAEVPELWSHTVSYTTEIRARYAAMIVMSKKWHETYKQLREIGWDRAAAIDMANITVGCPL